MSFQLGIICDSLNPCDICHSVNTVGLAYWCLIPLSPPKHLMRGFLLTSFSGKGGITCQDARDASLGKRKDLDLGPSSPKTDPLCSPPLCLSHYQPTQPAAPQKEVRGTERQCPGETSPRKWALPEKNCRSDRPCKQRRPIVNHKAVFHLEIGSLLSTQPTHQQ